MCGVWGCFPEVSWKDATVRKLLPRLGHRGPDEFQYCSYPRGCLAFYRLAIQMNNPLGGQPLHARSPDGLLWTYACNGEIYNTRELVGDLQALELSDCAAIGALIERGESWINIGKLLDGVFAIIALCHTTGQVVFLRDPFGVRPLFYSEHQGRLWVSSEAKSIPGHTATLLQPSHVGVYTPTSYGERPKHKLTFERYIDVGKAPPVMLPEYHDSLEVYRDVYDMLFSAVEKRQKAIDSDVDYGCFLSGGLDSSIVAAMLQKRRKDQGLSPLKTFSIGFQGSPDVSYAERLAALLGTQHTTVTMTEAEALEALPGVVESLESTDVTTVRASIGMWILSRWIRANTRIKVMFSGEGADEVCQGYLYFRRQPSHTEGVEESKRLVEQLHLYDVLRADRTTSAHSLELRVPFLDKSFVQHYWTKVPPSMQGPQPGKKRAEEVPVHGQAGYGPKELSSKQAVLSAPVEKYTLRRAVELFGSDLLLPDWILWRTKEAFSDGIASRKQRWLEKLQSHALQMLHREQVEKHADRINLHVHSPAANEAAAASEKNVPGSFDLSPADIEAAFYRMLWDRSFLHRKTEEGMGLPVEMLKIPRWMPRWVEDTNGDPSARALQTYSDTAEMETEEEG